VSLLNELGTLRLAKLELRVTTYVYIVPTASFCADDSVLPGEAYGLPLKQHESDGARSVIVE
jgi:hypothetical protein